MKIRHYKRWLLATCISCALAACDGGGGEVTQATRLEVQTYYESAKAYYRQGQFRSSILEMRNAVRLTPDNVEFRRFLAQTYFDIGDFEEALSEIDAGLALAPDNVELKLIQAETFLMTNRIDEGLEIAQSIQAPPELVLKKNWLVGNLQAAAGNLVGAELIFRNNYATDRTHIPTLIAMSKLNYMNGNLDAATKFVMDGIGLSGHAEPDLWIWRGQLALLTEDYPTAENAYAEALNIMSGYDLMTNKRYATLQSILIPLMMQHKDSELQRYAAMLAQTQQGEFNTNYNVALDLFKKGDIRKAEAELDALLVNTPDHPASNILKGLVTYASGNMQEAQDMLEKYATSENASSQVLGTLAATHLRTNDVRSALSVLEESLKNKPDDADLMVMIGVIQRGTGNFAASVDMLQKAAATAPTKADVRLALAGTYAKQGDDANSIAQLHEALAINPEFEEAKSALLDIYLGRGDVDAATATVQDWLRTKQDSVFNNMAAALLAIRTQNFASARGYLDYAVKLDSNNVHAMLYLARIDIVEKKYTNAADRLDKVLLLQPDNADALSGLLALGNLTGIAQSSIERIQQVIARNPSQFTPPLILAQYFLTKNNPEEALKYAELAYGAAQNRYTTSMMVDLCTGLAVAASQKQDLARVRELATRLLEVQPGNAQGIALLAGLESQSGNAQAALNHVLRLREAQPDSPASYELEGELALARQDVEGALQIYRSGWERLKAVSLGQRLYETLMRQGRQPEAATFLEAWVSAEPTNVPAKIMLAMDLQGRNQNARAIEMLEQVYQADPTHLIMLNNLAWLYQDSQPDRALELASKAAELYPDNAGVLDTYGWILLKHSDRQQALSVLQKAQQLSPDSASIREHLDQARN